MTLPSRYFRTEAQQELYESAVAEHGAALERLARSYEADAHKRQDLLQDIHLALWRSFPGFDGRCSLRTWVFRVAHNVATSHVVQQRRAGARLIGLEAVESMAGDSDTERITDHRMMIERLYALIRQLKPLDRQIVLLYLEDNDAASIAEITGLSAGNVATKVSRLKKILGDRARMGASYDA